MGTYRRTGTPRNNRHRAGGLLFFTTLLALTATCAITAYASANQPTTVIAGSYGEDMSRTKTNQEHTSAAQQPESVSSSERQPGGSSSPVHMDSESWMLTLVNADNPLPGDHSPKLKSLANGLQFDERAIDRPRERRLTVVAFHLSGIRELTANLHLQSRILPVKIIHLPVIEIAPDGIQTLLYRIADPSLSFLQCFLGSDCALPCLSQALR